MLDNNDLQAIAQLIQSAAADLKFELHNNNENIYSEMERLHDIQSRKMDSISQKIDSIRDNKEITDYLLQQVSELKKRVDELENKIA